MPTPTADIFVTESTQSRRVTGPMKTCFIVNPKSGPRRRAERFLPHLRRFAADRGLDARIDITEAPGHATALARVAASSGFECVAAVGGDGTVNEVAQALVGGPAALAIVPCGSGDGLGRHLRLPRSPMAALGLIASPLPRLALIDTGSSNGCPFFNVMGFGFDAEISQRFNGLKGRGLPGYVRTGVATFRERSSEVCRIQMNGSDDMVSAMLVAVANSDRYGHQARVAPRARVDDGLLDLVSVERVSWAGACLLAARLFLGTFDRSPRVRRWRGPAFTITRAAAGIIHTDGEVHASAAELRVQVHAASLRILVGG